MLKTKKGEKVVLLGFTGMRIGEFVATVGTKEEIHIQKADGTVLVFDRKTGIQKNMPEGKEKYANRVVDPADAPAPKAKAEPKAPAAKAPAAKAPAAKAEAKAPAAAPKKDDKKKTEKVPAAPAEDDFEDDDEGYEEV